jgi:hypothetical protein
MKLRDAASLVGKAKGTGPRGTKGGAHKRPGGPKKNNMVSANSSKKRK